MVFIFAKGWEIDHIKVVLKKELEGIIPVNGQDNNYVKKTSNKYFTKDNKRIYTDKLSGMCDRVKR